MPDSCDSKMQLILLMLLIPLLLAGAEINCPNTSATADTKPLYLLTLASIPDGLRVLSGARIARDEINNYTDLLPGYHIELIVDTIEGCSSFEAAIGLSNLVKYTVSPPCRPVVAVNGLECSSHTSLLSPVAGHDGYDLIQLSSANSPILQTQNHRFPRLWQFLGSATVYSDTILAILDQYNWNRIGVVFDVESVLYSEIANDIEQKVKVSGNKTIVFILGMRKSKGLYLDAAISNIKSQKITILVSLLNLEQEAALLHRTIDENLVYPNYTWMHVERLPQHLMSARGHLCLYTKSSIENETTVLVSGETFGDFKLKNVEDIKLIEQQYKHYNLTPSVFAGYWYDQVWAIALAVNNSLPVLENRNLSIDNYTIGQCEITDVIEEQLANLSFQGAGGPFKTNSVLTSVEVFRILDNKGAYKCVGVYNPLNSTHFTVDINSSDLPTDIISVPVISILIHVPPPVTILLCILTGVIMLFTTVQLILYLHYRHHKIIKATSPYLSLLMFIGCYLLCASAIFQNTIGSFELSSDAYKTLSVLHTFCLFNSASLILITLLVKLARIYQIFFAWMRKDLGIHWNNCSLLCLILGIAALPNVFFAILFAVRPLHYEIVSIRIQRGDIIVIERHILSPPDGFISITVLLGSYAIVCIVVVLYMSFISRKIRLRNFNDSRQVIFLLGVIFVTVCVTNTVFITLYLRSQEHVARILNILSLLAYALMCQLILFFPKLAQVVLENRFSRSRHLLTTLTVPIKSTVFS